MLLNSNRNFILDFENFVRILIKICYLEYQEEIVMSQQVKPPRKILVRVNF